MQIQDIKDLMDKMNETGLTVLELEIDGNRIKLEKAPAVKVIAAQESAGAQPTAQAGAEEAAVELEGHVVTSPVVGVYYGAAAPDSDPFVKVGSTVDVGSPLCIIEAMKLMNEVNSTVAGKVVEIMVENGQRVDFGQPLMRIGGV